MILVDPEGVKEKTFPIAMLFQIRISIFWFFQNNNFKITIYLYWKNQKKSQISIFDFFQNK